MKNVKILLLIPLFLYIADTQAQILNAIKNKAADAMTDAINRKIDEEINKAADRVVDKYWDRVIGKYYAGLYSDDAGGGFPFVLDTNVVLEDEYVFDRVIRMQIQTFDKKGKLEETSFMNTHTSNNYKYMGTSIEDAETEKNDQDIMLINDFKNGAFVMLMRDGSERSRLAYSVQVDTAALDTLADAYTDSVEVYDAAYPEFQSLGTKTIMGKVCKGYKYENTDGSMEMWLTDENIYGNYSIYNYGAAGTPAMITTPYNYPSGSIMEVSTIDNSSMEKSVMTVVDINSSAHVRYKIADYPTASEAQNR